LADAPWNSGAYAGLQRIHDSLGLAVSHVEARTPAERVSAEYPKTAFIVTSGSRAQGNVAPLIFKLEDASYLAGMVAGGRGMVSIHCSNIMGWRDGHLDPADRPLFDLLGNRYLSHGPGHHEGLHTIEIVAEHPVTAGVDDFDLFDEYYEFELADEKIQVLAQRHRGDGVVIPVMYAREVGAGRVVYLALGHDMRCWGEPPFRQLVRQALTWAAGSR